MAMHKSIIRSVSSIAQKFGYTIVPSWRLEHIALEEHLKALFNRYAIDSVFDVGANAGQFHDFLRKNVGFRGVIHSFEPISNLAEKIAQRAKSESNWHVHRHALGSQETTLDINVAASDVFSSFLEPESKNNTQFTDYTARVRQERVSVKRIDDIWRGLPKSTPDRLYLKIDTQGYDMEVLRGGPNLVGAIKALQFELSIAPIYKGTLHYLDVLRQLHDWGFVLSGLYPVTTDENLQVIEFDCIMVKRAA